MYFILAIQCRLSMWTLPHQQCRPRPRVQYEISSLPRAPSPGVCCSLKTFLKNDKATEIQSTFMDVLYGCSSGTHPQYRTLQTPWGLVCPWLSIERQSLPSGGPPCGRSVQISSEVPSSSPQPGHVWEQNHNFQYSVQEVLHVCQFLPFPPIFHYVRKNIQVIIKVFE